MESKTKPPASEKEVLGVLIQEVLDATAQKNAAFDIFRAVLDQFPSGLPHPDGSGQIASASQGLALARERVRAAEIRLSDFLERRRIVRKN